MDRFLTYRGMCKWAKERSLMVHTYWNDSVKCDHLSVYGVPFVGWIATDNGMLACEFDKNGTLVESVFVGSHETIGDVDSSGSLRSKLNHLMYGSTN